MKKSKILSLFLLMSFTAPQVSYSENINFTNIDAEMEFCTFYDLPNFEAFFKNNNPRPVGLLYATTDSDGISALFGINGQKVEFKISNNNEVYPFENVILDSENFNLDLTSIAVTRTQNFDDSFEELKENLHPEDVISVFADNNLTLTKAILSNKKGKRTINYIGYTCDPYR